MSLRPLSVIVPARDEEQRLPALLATVDDVFKATLAAARFQLAELIVVDDGSSDRTAELVATRAAEDPRMRLIRLEPRGKGAAARAGVLAATTPWALVMDADLSTRLDAITALGEAIDAGCDISIGSRGLEGSTIIQHQPRHRELAGRTFNVLVRTITGLPFRDTQCGFKLFRLATTRTLFEHQRSDGFAYDVEILLDAAWQGLRVAEVPVTWANDRQTRVRLFGASITMAADLVRIVRRLGRYDRPLSELAAKAGSGCAAVNVTERT
jgi:glycosyltransferase involved in cell wall biosynthesis